MGIGEGHFRPIYRNSKGSGVPRPPFSAGPAACRTPGEGREMRDLTGKIACRRRARRFASAPARIWYNPPRWRILACGLKHQVFPGPSGGRAEEEAKT